MTEANATPSSPFTHLRSPRFIENGDPLSDDGRLLYGPTILNEAEPQSPEVLRKSSSDQSLSPFRWGSNHRKTGRSKTGLSITVPGPAAVGEVQKQAQDSALITGPILRDKSILYTYSSSSSGGNKTGSSFGAIGDHTNADLARLNSPVDLSVPRKSARPRLEGAYQRDRLEKESTLQQLVETSQPDLQIYDILILGETGPLSQPRTARIVNASEFFPVLHRRHSLNDLVERSSTGNIASTVGHVSDASNDQIPRIVSPSNQGNSANTVVPSEPVQIPEIWRRRGPSFRELVLLASNQLGMGTSRDEALDPSTFSLPYGSLVYIMKSANIANLRHSIQDGVWSNKEGANKVLQEAWERKPAEAKILFIWSITHSQRHRSKFCGLAEMAGPWDPHARVPLFLEGAREAKGSIPVRWLVTKDVPFSAFDGIEYRRQSVCLLRHVNTIPGDVGRHTVKTYFEAPHATTAVLHPATSEDQQDQQALAPPQAYHIRDRFGVNRYRPHAPSREPRYRPHAPPREPQTGFFGNQQRYSRYPAHLRVAYPPRRGTSYWGWNDHQQGQRQP